MLGINMNYIHADVFRQKKDPKTLNPRLDLRYQYYKQNAFCVFQSA